MYIKCWVIVRIGVWCYQGQLWAVPNITNTWSMNNPTLFNSLTCTEATEAHFQHRNQFGKHISSLWDCNVSAMKLNPVALSKWNPALQFNFCLLKLSLCGFHKINCCYKCMVTFVVCKAYAQKPCLFVYKQYFIYFHLIGIR